MRGLPVHRNIPVATVFGIRNGESSFHTLVVRTKAERSYRILFSKCKVFVFLFREILLMHERVFISKSGVDFFIEATRQSRTSVRSLQDDLMVG